MIECVVMFAEDVNSLWFLTDYIHFSLHVFVFFIFPFVNCKSSPPCSPNNPSPNATD